MGCALLLYRTLSMNAPAYPRTEYCKSEDGTRCVAVRSNMAVLRQHACSASGRLGTRARSATTRSQEPDCVPTGLHEQPNAPARRSTHWARRQTFCTRDTDLGVAAVDKHSECLHVLVHAHTTFAHRCLLSKRGHARHLQLVHYTSFAHSRRL